MIDTGPMAYVRMMYHVPARRGKRVMYNGWPGRITSAGAGLIRVRLDSGQRIYVHPTDEKLAYSSNRVR